MKKTKVITQGEIWAKVLKYKFFELLAIPIIIFLPYLIGWCIIWIFGLDPNTTQWFCTSKQLDSFNSVCTGGYSKMMIWLSGFLTSLVIMGWVCLNYFKAEESLERERRNA